MDGGGAQHLYRKKKDRASTFLPDRHSIPEEGDFIFEQFLPTGGTDVKVSCWSLTIGGRCGVCNAVQGKS